MAPRSDISIKKTSGFKTKLASARFVPPLVNETLILTTQ